jgi:hypothetical protein
MWLKHNTAHAYRKAIAVLRMRSSSLAKTMRKINVADFQHYGLF